MSAALHRAIELLIGFALLGYCAFEIYAGKAQGKFRSYDRREDPGSFWISVLLQLVIGAAFLFGATSWHN